MNGKTFFSLPVLVHFILQRFTLVDEFHSFAAARPFTHSVTRKELGKTDSVEIRFVVNFVSQPSC